MRRTLTRSPPRVTWMVSPSTTRVTSQRVGRGFAVVVGLGLGAGPGATGVRLAAAGLVAAAVLEPAPPEVGRPGAADEGLAPGGAEASSIGRAHCDRVPRSSIERATTTPRPTPVTCSLPPISSILTRCWEPRT